MQQFNFSANNHYFQNLIQAVGLGALASILFMKRQGPGEKAS
jgi:hypothetical protein